MDNVIYSNKLGSLKKRAMNIKKVKPDDIIILVSKIKKTFCFIGVTMVNDSYNTNKVLYNYYHSTRKLNLKSIKFFKNPIKITKNIRKELNIKLDSSKEFIKISKENIEIILSKEKLTSIKPLDNEDITINLYDFIMNTIKSLYHLKSLDNKKQIEIKEFIKLLDHVLKEYGINKSYDMLLYFYAHNIWNLKYKHVPSRDPDVNILLYDASGKSRNFGYLVFEK